MAEKEYIEREALVERLKKEECDCEWLWTILDIPAADVAPVKVGERRIDDLGRIHIPKDVRLSLGINYGDVISMSISDESIILRKEREENA